MSDFSTGFAAGLIVGRKKNSGGDTPTEKKWEYPSNWLKLPNVRTKQAAYLIVLDKNDGYTSVRLNYSGTVAEGESEFTYIDWGDGNVYPDYIDPKTNYYNVHLYTFGNGTPLSATKEMYILKCTCNDDISIFSIELGSSNVHVYACNVHITALSVNCTVGVTQSGSNSRSHLQYLKITGNPSALFDIPYMWFCLNALDTTTIKRIDTEPLSGKLPDFAFYRLANISSVNLPDLSEVTELGNDCFKQCYSLKKLALPKVSTIGNNCFYNIELKELSLPELTSIGDKCFYQVYGAEKISLPKLQSAGKYSFQNSHFKGIDLPNLQTIGAYGFNGCNYLENLNLESLTSIENNTIGSGCYMLTNLEISDSIDMTQSGIFPASVLVK